MNNMYDSAMNNMMSGIAPTQQSIKDYICLSTNCTSVEMISEFYTMKARHICPNSHMIVLLEKSFIPVPTSKGIVNVEIFLCPRCGKLMINKTSLEVY